MKYIVLLLLIAMTATLIVRCVTSHIPNNTTPGGGTGDGYTNITACTVDSDCVPAECCHPTGCINRTYKEVCTLLCTASCEGPIDCGAGHCGCVNGTYGVLPGPGAP